MREDYPRGHDKQPRLKTPTYVLICQNARCRLHLQIGYPRHALDRCPRCGSPMSCRQEK